MSPFVLPLLAFLLAVATFFLSHFRSRAAVETAREAAKELALVTERIVRCESWIEFVGKAAREGTKALERPTHMERDSLSRRYRCEEEPHLNNEEKLRLAEIYETIATKEVDEIGEPNNATSGERLIAAVTAATIRYELSSTKS